MINRTIRNFEIKELIATGGMAAIYKAIQVSLDRVVAIKILHGHLAQDKNFITRFEREAKAAANLKQENIVNIIDYGKAEDIYFIAMEYVEGKSLKDLIGSVKFVPYNIALSLASEISKGLDHAHKKGVVHRDIKPANILIGTDGIIKIADFGLAQAQDLTSITVTGSIVGTPAYMSPEQAGGKKVDTRTDIFSLGVIIYEMITGVKPFSGENYSSVIHQILTVKPPKPVEANPLISKEVNDIIEKMLEKDLDKRYENISQVIEDISSYCQRKKIETSRKKIVDFMNAPSEHFKSLVEERKRKHFERGLYFMTIGKEKIDDAINEFNKVLHLDPDDSQAKKYIADLQKKKEKVVPVRKKTKEKKAEVPLKKNILQPAGIIGGILIVAIILFAVLKGRGRKPGSSDVSMKYGVARITSIPDNATIYLDGKDLGLFTPTDIDSLSVGEHKVEIRKTGFMTYTENLEIKESDTISLIALLVKETVVVKYGSIIVKSKPSKAAVLVDNVNKGETPCTLNNITEGSHKIRIVKKGYEPVVLNRKVSSGKQLTVSVTLSKKGTVTPTKQYSYLKINVTPWAAVFINDRNVGTTPIAAPIKILSGTHTVKLKNPSFKTWQDRITFKPGETKTLRVKLEPLEGLLKLTVKPWADVYIDGKYYAQTPIAKPIKLSAGKHTLKLVNKSYKTFQQSVDIPAGKMLKKYVELKPK